ncbi:dihydroxy-acid dehydratase [Exidia glandulosa HHB12029]|uniref:dihydroxy-acid dehydratase n=1 Tax=Exidia glandulosa HHB12029 TaxID=1314781 RepID=A0A165FFT7_EXIGL|nr:dihydroxy-acid dehydratase [Exidia glandulosa HHB12029]
MHRITRRALSTTRRVCDEQVLNRFSRNVTQPKQQGASQAMLYATDGVDSEEDLKKPMIGIGSVWYEGNPCNKHLLDIGKDVKQSVTAAGIIGYQFGTVGVSDGISMGTQGMLYSLPSRDLIADQIETAGGGHWLDGMVVIPGCDKNMPGVLMGVARLNRPSIMVYGGTIRAGHCPGPQPPPSQPLDIVSAFQAYGKYVAAGRTDTAEQERANTIRYACPGQGACGGMYTANTMASNAEVLGMTLPGSSSFPADSPEKQQECASIGPVLRNMLEKNILPSQILTKAAFDNAITLTMIMGGSTNAVLHLIAIAANVGIRLRLEDFERIADKTPVLADLRPSGKYVFEDIYKLGGIPKIVHYLIENDFIDGDTMTVTGKSLRQNADEWVAQHGKLPFNQDIIRPLGNPIKSTGHIRVLRGNLAPGGAISKITGKEGLQFEGRARVYNSEDEFLADFEKGTFVKGEKVVIVLRYLGPRGGPGMPEMLKPTSMIMGAGLGNDVAFVTDGRFSGGSHGFVVGHVVPEAMAGGRIGLVENGDLIKIDAVKNTIEHIVSRDKLKARKRKAPYREGLKRGWLRLYSLNVESASYGCVLGIRRDLRSRLVDFKEPAWRTKQKVDERRDQVREKQIVEAKLRRAQKVAANQTRLRVEAERKAKAEAEQKKTEETA